MDKHILKSVFQQFGIDSSDLTALNKDSWKVSSQHYKDKVGFLFHGKPADVTFYKLFNLPFPSQLNDNKKNLKPLLIPYYNNVNSIIRLVRNGNDNASFYQLQDTTTIKYKLEIHEMSLSAYRIRFVGDFGFNLNASKVFKNNSGSLALPSLCMRFETEPIQSSDLWFDKTFYNVQIPSKILIFRVGTDYLSGGGSTAYSKEDTDSWKSMILSSHSIQYNGLDIYSDRVINPFVTNTIIQYMNHKKLGTSFISNYPLSEDATYNVRKDSKYSFPSILIDLTLWRCGPNPKVSPLIGCANSLDSPGDLKIRLDYSSLFTDRTGVIAMIWIYENKRLAMQLQEGFYYNPLSV